MNSDLLEINKLLSARFPKSIVRTIAMGTHCSGNPVAEVQFNVINDCVAAIGSLDGKTVGFCICEHVDDNDFKPSGTDLGSARYEGPKQVVERLVDAARLRYRQLVAFEDEEDAALADYGMKRDEVSDPRCAFRLLEEIGGLS